MSSPAQGWTWVTYSITWHYFVGEDAICGKWQIEDLDPAELQAEQQPSIKYCLTCQKKVKRAAETGVAVDGALTDEQRAYLTANWATKTANQLADELGIVDKARVRAFCHNTLPRKGSNAGGFKPGHVPANKGKKGWCAPGSEKGWFKKGHLPQTTHPEGDGAITIRKDNRGVEQQYIRVSLGKWEYLSRYTWEQAHGPLKRTQVIAFKNGNTLDCRLDNLECITRKENLERNAGRKDLTDAYVARKFSQVGRGTIDRELEAAVLQRPDVLEAKRQVLKTGQLLKQLNNLTNDNSGNNEAPADDAGQALYLPG